MPTDKERLDWLQSMGYAIRSRYFGVRNLVVWNENDLRSSIDCAMTRHVKFVKGQRKDAFNEGKAYCIKSIKGQPF